MDNDSCTYNHVNNVKHEEYTKHALYNLTVIRDICKKSKKLESKLRKSVKNVKVYTNQIILKMDPKKKKLKISQSTIEGTLKSNRNIVPHYLFLIGLENFGKTDNAHAIAAIVRDKKLYLFNPTNKPFAKTKNSTGDILSESDTYVKVYEVLIRLVDIDGTYVYTGRNLQEGCRTPGSDYSISCTLFSEYFLLHKSLYKTLSRPMTRMTQRTYDRISFTQKEINERTKYVPVLNKTNNLSRMLKNMRLVPKRKRNTNTTNKPAKKSKRA